MLRGGRFEMFSLVLCVVLSLSFHLTQSSEEFSSSFPSSSSSSSSYSSSSSPSPASPSFSSSALMMMMTMTTTIIPRVNRSGSEKMTRESTPIEFDFTKPEEQKERPPPSSLEPSRVKTVDGKSKRKKKTQRCIHAKCRCSEFDKRSMTADCDAAFRTLPRFHVISTTLERLSIRRANLTSLPPAAFKAVRTKELDLAENNFSHSKIENSSFDGLEKWLQVLIMGECQLEEIPTEGISILRNLRFLYLDGNKITEVKPGSFANNRKLMELHMSENEVGRLLRGSLEGLQNLDFLVFSQNRLQYVEEKSFIPLHRLTHLDISGNLLEEIRPGMFDGLSNLRWLKLDSNFIRKLERDSFRDLEKLRNLKLENNPVHWIDEGTFNGVPRLSYVSLDLTRVVAISNGTFEGLVKLTTLNMGEFPAALRSATSEGDVIFSSSSRGILSPLVELRRISLTDFEGNFGGLWKDMLSNELDYEELSVFVVPTRECNCSQEWIDRLISLGAYVHGFCLDGRALSCKKDASLGTSRKSIEGGEGEDGDDDDHRHGNASSKEYGKYFNKVGGEKT